MFLQWITTNTLFNQLPQCCKIARSKVFTLASINYKIITLHFTNIFLISYKSFIIYYFFHFDVSITYQFCSTLFFIFCFLKYFSIINPTSKQKARFCWKRKLESNLIIILFFILKSYAWLLSFFFVLFSLLLKLFLKLYNFFYVF